MSSFVGAIAIADLVKTTLGPKGMDKILQSVSDPNNVHITITNDGATILRSVPVENPAAKVLVDIARIQDETIGDGTTSVTVLCGELLREAEFLIQQHIHPATIINGWRLALKICKNALQNISKNNLEGIFKKESDDTPASSEEEKKQKKQLFLKDLKNIASTTLSSKILSNEKDFFSDLVVDAILRITFGGKTNFENSDQGFNENYDLTHIQILKKPGGNLKDSFLEDGFILNKNFGIGQPTHIKNARILIANTSLDTDKIKIYGTNIKVNSIMKLNEIEIKEKEKIKNKIEKIKNFNINCLINRQLIYNYPESLLTEAGIISIEHADFDGIERLAAVLGGEIVSTFDHPELCTVGYAEEISEIMIGEDKLIRFSGCKNGQACTIILRGASGHLLDEAERSLHDALCVLLETIKENKVINGGGCAEIHMGNAVMTEVQNILSGKSDLVSESSTSTSPKLLNNKEILAMESFARALYKLPMIIADNAGLDSSTLLSELKAAHFNGQHSMGIDVMAGTIGDMQALGIRESYKSKLQVLVSAAEAAEMILRVDEIIKCAPRQRE